MVNIAVNDIPRAPFQECVGEINVVTADDEGGLVLWWQSRPDKVSSESVESLDSRTGAQDTVSTLSGSQLARSLRPAVVLSCSGTCYQLYSTRKMRARAQMRSRWVSVRKTKRQKHF